MGYVNFKEERYAALTELYKRKENNKMLYKSIMNNKKMISLDYWEKYSFKVFKKGNINKAKYLNEDNYVKISEKTIVCSQFEEYKISNIHFIGCTFIGCKFINCDFSKGVIFENCIFILDELNNVPSLNVKDNYSCEFKKCNLYAKFLNCDISYLIIEDSSLKNTNFELTDMTSCIINSCNMKKIELVDDNLSGMKIINTYVEDLEFNDKYLSKLDEKTFFDTIPFKKKNKSEYEGIYKTYETYADIFKANSLNNNFGEYYFLCKKVQRKSLKFLPKMESYIYYITCGYGERVEYSLFTSLAIIIFFSFLYIIFGIEIENKIIQYITGNGIPNSIGEFIRHINYAFTLSIDLFAGIGADIAKPSELSFFISNLEKACGIIMTGVIISTLTRKIIR